MGGSIAIPRSTTGVSQTAGASTLEAPDAVVGPPPVLTSDHGLLAGGLLFAAAPAGPWGWQGLMKRLLDLGVAIIGLAVLAPVMLIVALLIKVDSPGPVFIRQLRVGRSGRSFRLYKFRSMVADADRLQPELGALNEVQGPLFKIRSDPRITGVGRWIRKYSLDEVPQLVNVLRGEMSIVGPRPPFDHEVEHDYLRQSLRLKFPPGMTGLWQVSGRSGLGYDAMIRLDLQYTRQWSIWLDLKILLRTVPVVVTGKGAC